MKKIIYVFIGLILVIASAFIARKIKSNIGETTDLTEVQVVNKIINIGNRNINEPSIATFEIKNTGKYDLVIQNIATDCHCTVPTWNTDPSPPGESLMVEVAYDNHMAGFFQQAITVELNAINSPVLLIMRGNITQ